MTRHPLRLTAVALGLIGLAAAPARAQYAAPTFAIEGNAIYGTVSGRDLRNLGDATGFDVQGRLGVQALSVGVGYLRTSQSISGPSSDIVLQGPFIEPRLALPFYYSSFTPYLTGRLARLRQSSGGDDTDITATSIGGGLGLLVRLAPAISLNLAGTYQSLRYKDTSTGVIVFDDGRSNGSSVDIRAGISIGFPR